VLYIPWVYCPWFTAHKPLKPCRMKVQTIVARNLRRLRVEQGVSQEALAVDAKVDRTYVSRLERAIENPTILVLERLAKALGSDVAAFFDKTQVARGPVKPLPGGRHSES
jgi:DNA-binding XRE family transcriptional regulator